MIYRVFIVKEALVDADSYPEACDKALYDDDYIVCDEYLDDERNSTDGGIERDD